MAGLPRGGEAMTLYQTLHIAILSATLIVAIVTLLRNNKKK